jgi:catechol 2,3-dioxygenase-like lactoylglutathione lyase family enzyme
VELAALAARVDALRQVREQRVVELSPCPLRTPRPTTTRPSTTTLQPALRDGVNLRLMIDHVSVRVQDFPRLLAFYRDALAPIGYGVVMEYPGAVGLGAEGKPDLWLMQTDQALNPTHVALISTRDRIDAFHAAGLSAGGTDNGPPGLRVDYHPSYYAAYVRDPEGNNIEVVCHAPPQATKAARPSGKGKAPAKAKKKAAARKPARAKAKPKKKKR